MNTLDYYNNNAKKYFDMTVDADMSEQYNFFLQYVKGGRLLDLGCGSGRDSLYFKNLGFEVTAIDGSEELCKLASLYTGLDVKCMRFDELREIGYYDGIWASASLLHVDKRFLIYVLKRTRDALKQSGYMYAAMKNGVGEEVTREGRYFGYSTFDEFSKMSNKAGLEVVDFYSSKSVSNPNELRYWNNYILKKKR
jgi:2-polyprenyl-3-methyl-5-hydroxy-6-metoxy-1,4-benzoquinol methylase